MKYYFIVNPAAGTRSAEQALRAALQARTRQEDYTVYVTKGPGDAALYLSRIRQEAQGPLRVIACGGDGTLNMVANAVQGMKDVSVGCYACGSGNDYIRYYGKTEDFLDLDRLFAAQPRRVDLMSVNGRAAVNMVHFGFYTKVVEWMEKLRRLPLIGGQRAYYAGVACALLGPMSTSCALEADGEALHTGSLLLATLGCGRYVGGGYRCAPRSDNADGLMEICLAKPISRLKLLKLMNDYRQGTHLDEPRLKEIIVYRRARGARLSFPDETGILLDGEMLKVREAVIRLLPGALEFLVPAGL